MFRKCWPKSRFWPKLKLTFLTILTKIENFQQVRPKSRFFDKFDQIWYFSTIFTKFDIFENFDQYRDIWKFLTKVDIYLQILTQIDIFSEIFTKNKIWGQFWPKSILPKILTKIEIFQKFWPKSRFRSKLTKNLDFGQNVWKISFSPLFRLTTKYTSKPTLLTLCTRNPSMTEGFLAQRVSKHVNHFKDVYDISRSLFLGLQTLVH